MFRISVIEHLDKGHVVIGADCKMPNWWLRNVKDRVLAKFSDTVEARMYVDGHIIFFVDMAQEVDEVIDELQDVDADIQLFETYRNMLDPGSFHIHLYPLG